MKPKTLLFVVATLFLTPFAYAGDTYKPDPAHTTVGFTTTHLLINKVHGRFKEYEATILFDENDITKSSMTGTIKTASIDTGNENRDADLKSENFFDAEKYPEITFQSKKIEKSADGYTMLGTLTIRGISKDVTLPLTIAGPIRDPWGNRRIGVQARMKLNRQDFKISWNKVLEGGGAVVADEAEIHIDCELVKQSPPASK